MHTIWQNLTEGQGAVIAALVTLVAAVTGVVLGWILFGGKVRDLESALKSSDENIHAHMVKVDDELDVFGQKVDQQLAAVLRQLNTLGGALDERLGQVPTSGQPSQQSAKQSVRDNWNRIREQLESIASDPKIDGRTRAKYGRIDRRSYWDLVTALDTDGMLGMDGELYRAAVELWHKYRNGRSTPPDEDVRRMGELAERITGANVSQVGDTSG